MLTYRLKEDIIYDVEGECCTVYGIEAVMPEGSVIQSFSDIFFSRNKAERLVRLCNNEKLALIHLADAVEDALTEQYAV